MKGDHVISADKDILAVLPTPSALHAHDQDAATGNEQRRLNHALLVSSFSDGIQPNPEAQQFLIDGIIEADRKQRQQHIEDDLRQSVLASPCNGPDPELLSQLENVADSELKELRFLYIPTAMYALRAESMQTPGKQRQRARADGKKRRNQIVAMLQQHLSDDAEVHVTTLDFMDGSLKQSEGTDDTSKFPVTAREALTTWQPHFVYVPGGNTFWLHHCMQEWRDDFVDTVCSNCVYCGTSAGAILMGRSMQTACWKGWDDPSVVPDRPTYEDWQDVKGLDLVNGASFFPHMTPEWQDVVYEKMLQHDKPVYCLADEEAVCYKGRLGEENESDVADGSEEFRMLSAATTASSLEVPSN